MREVIKYIIWAVVFRYITKQIYGEIFKGWKFTFDTRNQFLDKFEELENRIVDLEGRLEKNGITTCKLEQDM